MNESKKYFRIEPGDVGTEAYLDKYVEELKTDFQQIRSAYHELLAENEKLRTKLAALESAVIDSSLCGPEGE